jgi:hypothetical protein
MQASNKPWQCVDEDKQAPVTTFKSSLRAWQARYRGERAARISLAWFQENQEAVTKSFPESVNTDTGVGD